MGREKKYIKMLTDKKIVRWYDDLERGSKITADTYLRRLGSFCATVKMSHSDIVKLSEKEIFDLMADYASFMSKQKKAGSFVRSTFNAVYSWLSFNNIRLYRRVKIKGRDDTPTLREERVPTQEELKKIFLSGDHKGQVACVLMAHSGLRPEVLGSYLGEDGLTVGDLPELKIEDGKVEFENIPTLVIVRKELSKSSRQYMTFLGSQGCEYVRLYLEERMREGESLTGDSPIITPLRRSDRERRHFIRTINIGDIIRLSIRKAGFQWRPYVLRAYFDTQMMLAESKGLVLRDYRQFWMGHVGDIEHRYTVNKHRLPDEVIKSMRESYAKALRYLETENKGLSEDEENENIRSLIRVVLIGAGYTNEEIDKNDMLSLPYEELANKIGEKKALSQNNGHKQKPISLNEVELYIEKG
jgi:integrase